jgi:hypothetical protein
LLEHLQKNDTHESLKRLGDLLSSPAPRKSPPPGSWEPPA